MLYGPRRWIPARQIDIQIDVTQAESIRSGLLYAWTCDIDPECRYHKNIYKTTQSVDFL